MNNNLPFDLIRKNSETMAERLKILAHPDRLLMLCRMADDEVTVGQLVALTGLSQSAVSQHLAKFRESDLVLVRPDGQTRYYRLIDEGIRAIIHALCEICERGEGNSCPA